MGFYFLLLFVFCLDQFTKLLALHYLSDGSIPVIPGIFHFTLVYNPGIAFGIFRQHPEILLVLISISLLILFFWGIRNAEMNRGQRLAVAVILGGALGNWIDRLRLGAVIDFFDFQIWPVFNVADTAITVGVTLLAWHFIRKKS